MNDSDLPEIDEAGFDAQVLGRPGVSVVDFWSVSCIPCRQMTRLLREIAPELPPQACIVKVNADENPGLVERYGVRGLPTLLMFKDGVLVETRTGIDRRQVLKKVIEAHS